MVYLSLSVGYVKRVTHRLLLLRPSQSLLVQAVLANSTPALSAWVNAIWSPWSHCWGRACSEPTGNLGKDFALGGEAAESFPDSFLSHLHTARPQLWSSELGNIVLSFGRYNGQLRLGSSGGPQLMELSDSELQLLCNGFWVTTRCTQVWAWLGRGFSPMVRVSSWLALFPPVCLTSELPLDQAKYIDTFPGSPHFSSR